MKKCPYCGRENHTASVHCDECGTELGPEQAVQIRHSPQDEPARDRPWLKAAMFYIGITFLVGFLYFTSFGPVTRFCCTVVSQSSNGLAQGFGVTRTVRYPGWVGLVYQPAFELSEGNSRLSEFYRDYLGWWEKDNGQQ